MLTSPVIEAMPNRKSIRKYKEDQPSDEMIATVVRAGQQAPFAMQLRSLLLSRNRKKNPFRAPLLFTVCVDSHRHEKIMARRGWKMIMNDLSLLLYGIQDAALMAENSDRVRRGHSAFCRWACASARLRRPCRFPPKSDARHFLPAEGKGSARPGGSARRALRLVADSRCAARRRHPRKAAPGG